MQEIAPPRLGWAILQTGDAPPSMEEVMEVLDETQSRRWFRAMTQDLLPEESEEILAGENDAAIVRRFGSAFSERYFPVYESIAWDIGETGSLSLYSDLRTGIPLEMEGVDDEAWHDVWDELNPGMGTIALLPEITFDPGIRTAWLEEAARYIPMGTLKRIPPGGIPIDRIERALSGTRLDCAADALRWFFRNSGNLFVDLSQAMYYESVPASWDRETVMELGEEWRQAIPILEGSIRAQKWMEEDPPARFAELLDLVLEGMERDGENAGQDAGQDAGQEEKREI